MGKKDALWKSVLEEVFDDMLRFVFPDAERIFDIGRGFEFLDKELCELYPEHAMVTDTLFVDKLVKVFCFSGKEQWLLCHVEVQGDTRRPKEFGERMFRYYYRILDRWHRPVTAVAFFTGGDNRRMPELFTTEFLGTELRFRYNTLRLDDYAEEELLSSSNPFALVLLAAKKALLKGKMGDRKLVDQKFLVARHLMRGNRFPRKKVEAILLFLNNVVTFENPEMNRIFEGKIDQLTNKKNTMTVIEQLAEIKAEEAMAEGLEKGRAEGIKKGRAEEREKAVRAFLANTEFSVEKIAELVEAPIALVRKIKKELARK
jgi:hypothetical protein